MQRFSAGAPACVNNAILLLAAPLPGYAAATAAVIPLSWHSIAKNNEITDTSQALLRSRCCPDDCYLRMSLCHIHTSCNDLNVATRSLLLLLLLLLARMPRRLRCQHVYDFFSEPSFYCHALNPIMKLTSSIVDSLLSIFTLNVSLY